MKVKKASVVAIVNGKSIRNWHNYLQGIVVFAVKEINL